MIQWFPGHMAKARREMEEKLPLVDVVIELVDARAPAASQNPMLQEVIKDKYKIIVLMKSDLADHRITSQWLTYFKANKVTSIAVDVFNKSHITNLIQVIHEVGYQEQQKMIHKGVKERPVLALISGVLNVSKSTLINRLANKQMANIGDRPEVTKPQQCIKVMNQFELLDTPQILWPKIDNELIGIKLASIRTIKIELVPQQ